MSQYDGLVLIVMITPWLMAFAINVVFVNQVRFRYEVSPAVMVAILSTIGLYLVFPRGLYFCGKVDVAFFALYVILATVTAMSGLRSKDKPFL